jgi:hypothetical protein
MLEARLSETREALTHDHPGLGCIVGRQERRRHKMDDRFAWYQSAMKEENS